MLIITYALNVLLNNHKIQITQNKVIRYLLNPTPRMEPRNLKSQLDSNIIKSKSIKFKPHVPNHKKQAPKYLQISLLREQHNLSTRYSQNAVIVPHVKHSGANSFVYIASTLWKSSTKFTVHQYKIWLLKRHGSIVKYEHSYFNAYISF